MEEKVEGSSLAAARNVITRYTWLPTILWIGLIFFLSTRELSFFYDPEAKEIESLFEILQYPVHFFLYLVLYALSFNSFLSGKYKTLSFKAIAAPLALTLLVAFTDELLQSLIPSRTFAVRDLISDTVGAVAGMGLVTLYPRIEEGFVMFYRFWQRWKAFAHIIGNFQSRLLLSIFYFLVLSPFGLGVKLFSDPLRLKKPLLPTWIPRSVKNTDPWEEAQRQS